MRFDQHVWYQLVGKCIPRTYVYTNLVVTEPHRVTKLRLVGYVMGYVHRLVDMSKKYGLFIVHSLLVYYNF